MRKSLIHTLAATLVSAAVSLDAAESQFRARLVAEINPGAAGSFPEGFTAFGDALYFKALSLSTGWELWRLREGTVTLAADINPTVNDLGGGVMVGNHSHPTSLIAHGQLYFSAFEPRRGGELWRFDGSQASRVADINPDLNDTIKTQPNSSWPNELTILNGVLYFSANSGAVRENYELWSYNGAEVREAANIRPDSGADAGSSYPTGLTVFGGSLFFMADDGANGYELWKHSGTQTTLLNINPGGPTSSSFPKFFTAGGSHLYFQAFHAQHGYELWRTDGATVALAADIIPGPESSNPRDFVWFNNALYFQASDSTRGSELFRFDGSATVAADINPAGDSFPKNLTVFGNTLVFAADDGTHGFELWKFDGSTATLVTNLNASGDSFPDRFHIHNGLLFFAATTPETGYEFWSYDGSTVRLAADINPGPGSSYPRELASHNGQLYFSAAGDGQNNWELWTLEPAETNEPASPTIMNAILSGTTISITVSVTTGSSHALEATTDFVNWTRVATAISPNGTLTFTDTITARARFYRVVAQ